VALVNFVDLFGPTAIIAGDLNGVASVIAASCATASCGNNGGRMRFPASTG
jgi:hypothetical protein